MLRRKLRDILFLCCLASAGLALKAAAENPNQGSWDPVEGRKLAVKAVGDCGEGRVEACRAGLLAALARQHGHLEFLQFLASAEERLGHGPAALAALAEIHRRGFDLTFDPPDEWVARVATRPEYQQLLQETAALRAARVHSSEAFRLPDRELIPEGIAYDPKTGAFFVGSVRQRRIVRRSAQGELRDFVPAASGDLWSVLGMTVDPARRHLWVTTTAYPQMVGFEERLAGRSALLCFDLDSGQRLGRYEATTPGGKGFNDVRVAPDGAVFVTDHEERPGTLYRLDPKTRQLAPFGPADALGSPEGLTFSSDGRYLFVADYSYGIVRFELATGQVLYLEDPLATTLIGLDHLEFYRGDLIAIQNGNRPHSVVRLHLAADLGSISGFEILEQRHPGYSDPTLGTLVGDELYFVANSQWGRFDAKFQLPPADQLQEPLILRLPLGGETKP